MTKTILSLLIVGLLVGCGTTSWTSDPSNPQNVIVETAIRKELNKPTGELTKEDLTKLKWVNLEDTKITDTGLKEVAKLVKFTELDLDRTNITDVGLKEIVGMKNLVDLDLFGTQITDAGLKELAKKGNLTWLGLVKTGISDKGLKEMANLKNLTYLDARGCPQITAAQIAELRKALPKCEIRYGTYN
jgi:Leucine-rich repeat (LRR) protein